MFNRQNNHEGEITRLDEQDISDILSDMHNPYGNVKIFKDDNDMVVIEYPFNICRLESRKKKL